MRIILALWLVSDCEFIHNHPRIWLWCGAWDLLWVDGPGERRALIFFAAICHRVNTLISLKPPNVHKIGRLALR